MKREDGKRCKRKAKKDEMECNLGKDGREAGGGPQADDVAVRSPERVAVGPWRGFGWLALARSLVYFLLPFFFKRDPRLPCHLTQCMHHHPVINRCQHALPAFNIRQK